MNDTECDTSTDTECGTSTDTGCGTSTDTECGTITFNGVLPPQRAGWWWPY